LLFQTTRKMANGFNNLGVNDKSPHVLLEDAPPPECKTLHTQGVGSNGARPHVLFIIDELCEMGGPERDLLKTVRLLPRQRFRCSLLTLEVKLQGEEARNIACWLYVRPLKKAYDLNAFRVARQIRLFIKEHKV